MKKSDTQPPPISQLTLIFAEAESTASLSGYGQATDRSMRNKKVVHKQKSLSY
ncbi:MAG: hypothetical protein IJ729_04475 [Alloprevotella sp.]|nr:hypothetical protein [Alloprevotella sp.]